MTSPLLTTYPALVSCLLWRVERGRGRERVLALVELRTLADGWTAWRVGVRALARELGEDRSNVARSLASLVGDGLLWRDEDGALSLTPGPHHAELVRDDDRPPAPKAAPRPVEQLPSPPQVAVPPSRVTAPSVFDDELRAILGRQDLDPATLAELEAQDLAAITAPRTPRSPSHARPPATHQALEDHQVQEEARPPLAPEPPRSPDLARRVPGVAHPADGRGPQEVAPKASPARAAWVRHFGAPRRPEDHPWEGLRAMTQGQILTVILLLLEVRAREGRLRNLAVMSKDKGEAVLRGEFVAREWTAHELDRAAKGVPLADILAARMEDDSSNTPLASDLLAALPPAPPPASPEQRRAALDQIRALLADHLPPDLATKEPHP